LLESALARPRASVFGQDAYPDLHLKAAALLHSPARNHALVDGNKRLAWTACRTFLAINGQ
jgi:death-on-curing protein